MFAGIGPSADVAAYLEGVSRDQIRDIDLNPDRVRYRRRDGDAVPAPPGEQTFWVATSSTTSEAGDLTWEVESGDWTVVLMNADASRGRRRRRPARHQGRLVPARPPSGSSPAGSSCWSAARRWPSSPAAAWPGPGEPVAVTGPAGPARRSRARRGDRSGAGIPGRRVPSPAPPTRSGSPATSTTTLSRGLWLVKWLLAIPHYIVLAFLWLAFLVVTIIAFFAILFTGRYPRGAVRLQRRRAPVELAGRLLLVQRARHGPLPTLLARPGRLPGDARRRLPRAQLSRGLVLVKWWLLAIPHYLVVGIFGSGWWLGWWGRDDAGWDDRGFAGSFGLIGLLVLFAGVALLFRGRYPSGHLRLRDGLNRWVYRVVAYVTLMTDVYPPFRLDQGEDEPVVAAAPPLADAVEP